MTRVTVQPGGDVAVSRAAVWLVWGVALGAMILIAGRTTTWPWVWTDLAVGRAIWAGGIPRTDVFTFTGAGEPWLDVQWLYHAAAWLWWRWGGGPLLAAAGLASVVGAFSLVLWPEWRRGSVGALISVALLMWLGAGRWQVDSRVLAMMPTSALVFALRRGPRLSRLL